MPTCTNCDTHLSYTMTVKGTVNFYKDFLCPVCKSELKYTRDTKLKLYSYVFLLPVIIIGLAILDAPQIVFHFVALAFILLGMTMFPLVIRLKKPEKHSLKG